MDEKRNNAARIIQRSIRKYLKESKKRGNSSNINNSPFKSMSKIATNFKKAYSSAALTEMQTEINESLAKLNVFYKNMPKSQERVKYLDSLTSDIFNSVQNLRKITKLEDCIDLKFETFGENVRARHEAMLNEQSEKWWENLNKCDSD